MKKIRNVYACLGLATMLTSMTFVNIDVLKYLSSNMDNFMSVMPVVVFIMITVMIAASNWVFMLFIRLFDAITSKFADIAKENKK